jgi:predicted DsbA family dithiol-disulfide isomerase
MLHLAAEHGTASEFMDTVQRDLLGEGINAYTAAYLADAASKAGVPAGRAKALLAGDEYADAVRGREARPRGGRHRRPLHRLRRRPGHQSPGARCPVD